MLITNTAFNRFYFYTWTNNVELRVNTGEHGNSAAGSESDSDMTFLCFAEIVNLIVGILLYKKDVFCCVEIDFSGGGRMPVSPGTIEKRGAEFFL